MVNKSAREHTYKIHSIFPWVSDTTTLLSPSLSLSLTRSLSLSPFLYSTTIQSLQYLHFKSQAAQKQHRKQNKTMRKTTCKDFFSLPLSFSSFHPRIPFYSISREEHSKHCFDCCLVRCVCVCVCGVCFSSSRHFHKYSQCSPAIYLSVSRSRHRFLVFYASENMHAYCTAAIRQIAAHKQ